MSRTMLSASSSGRRKVASTTKVAPCSRRAGPKTSPSKLCATITWSRTVTLNNGSLSSVGPVVHHPVAQCRQLAGGQPRQHARELLEPALPGDERVVRGVGEQVEGQREPVVEGAA